MTIYLVALGALLLVDWWQTLRIARNPGRWCEVNPILGPHPSPARVSVWFSACLLALIAGSYFLPGDYLRPLAFVWIVAEVICVVNNLRLGIR